MSPWHANLSVLLTNRHPLTMPLVIVVLAVLASVTPAFSSDTSSTADIEQTVQSILAIDADPDFGEFLAGECLTCHTPGKTSDSIPMIHGAEPAHLIQSLLEYQRGLRDNDTMRSVASALSQEDIAALVRYLAGET